MERVNHFLLLLMIVAIVQVLRLVLLVQFCTRFQTLVRVLTAQLSLHVCQVRLLRVWMGLSQAALQILTHANHARVISRWTVNLRPLCAPLKFIETTRSSFTGIGPTSPVAIGNVTTLEGLLAGVDAGQSCGLALCCLLLGLLLVLCIGVATVHDVLLGQLVLVGVVVEIVTTIHAI